ncbi:MAG: hypothetical protein JNM38_02520 [Acidobacteria bacterium]|jgi:hypothetical protein|nr:hypothetical protein [Acidobacteriota bacterium]
MSTANPFVASDDEHWFAPAPRWWSGVLGGFDRVAVAWIGRAPGARIVAIDRLGRRMHAAGLVPPTPEATRALFPDIGPTEAARIARDAAALRFKNRAAIALLQRRGLDALAQLADPPAPAVARLDMIRGGAVLIAFHLGAQFGVGATLHALGRRTMTVRNMPVGDGHERARALRQAVDELRGGSLVIAAVDGPGGASTGPMTCLGRRIVLRRGPFVLARLARVPILPVVARWTPAGRITIELGDPLASAMNGTPADIEQQLANAAGRWFAHQLTTHPDDLWPYTLANLLDTPRAAATTT